MARPENKLNSPKKRQDRYLAARLKYGTLSAGCRAAKVSRNTIYAWRSHDQEDGYTAAEFSQLEKDAAEAFADRLEEEAVRRAHKGVNEPVYQGGAKVGEVTKYSDTLLIFLLKGARPEKFRERISAEHSGPGGAPIPVQATVTVDLGALSTEELLQLEAMAGKVAAKPPASDPSE